MSKTCLIRKICSPLFAEKMSKHKQLGIMCHLSNKHTRQFVLATVKGRDTLFDAINKRQDDVYRRLYDEINSLSLVPLNEIKYHRSCNKAYTSKGNLQWFVSYVPE